LSRLRARRLWPLLALGCLLWSLPARSFGQAPPEPETTIDAPDEETAELEEEVGDRDPTYLRTRTVFSYDRRRFESPITIDRFRLRLLYAFGPKQRFALSVLAPVIQVDTPSRTATGAGDSEAQFTANLYYTPRFRTGAAVQTTFQTSSDALIGGATTFIRPSWDLAAIFSSRIQVTAVLYYKRSIHTARGIPFNQLEPDITLNARVLKATWFLEADSFYDIVPDRFAPTIKTGISRRFGGNRSWVASAYYAAGLNDWARQTQYRRNVGLDVTWYPLKYR